MIQHRRGILWGTFGIVTVAAMAIGLGARGRPRGRVGDLAPASDWQRNVPYVTTPPEAVDRMLVLAGTGPDDLVADLGCGDGRIAVRAAEKFHARGLGVERDPRLVSLARQNARAQGVADRVEIRQDDLFHADLNGATVVTLFLSPTLNAQLKPILNRLPHGTRIVTRNFELPGVTPAQTLPALAGGPRFGTLYLYIVPWNDNSPTTNHSPALH